MCHINDAPSDITPEAENVRRMGKGHKNGRFIVKDEKKAITAEKNK